MKKVITICLVIVLFGTGYARADTWTTLDFIPSGIDGTNIVGGNILYDMTTGIKTTLDVPGNITGISGTNIVGSYGDHGFLYNGASWTTLDFIPSDIDGTNIVGGNILYDMTTGIKTTLDVPGNITGISGSNIVGSYSNHGFLYNGTSWTTLDLPGAYGTSANGIDGSTIVGSYYCDYSCGFFYNGNWDTVWTFRGPGIYVNNTYATSISGSNIVGYYDGIYSGWYGFIYTVPEPTTICLLGLGALGLLRKRRV